MGIVLRIVGGFWVLYSVRIIVAMIRGVAATGPNYPLGLMDLLYVLVMAGGVGLVFLKEWGRWLVLLCCVAFLLLSVGSSLLQLRFPAYLLRPLIFYGVFIVLLALPQARAATKK